MRRSGLPCKRLLNDISRDLDVNAFTEAGKVLSVY